MTVKAMCETRKAFTSQQACLTVVRRMAQHDGKTRFAVHCSHCGKWHLARMGEQW